MAQDSAVFDEDEDYENENEYEDGDRTDNAIESNNSTPQPSPGMMLPSSLGHASGTRVVSGRRLLSTTLQRNMIPNHRLSVSHGGRRFSTASGNMPAIFANTGLRTPPASIRYEVSPSAGVQNEEDPFFATPGPRAGVGGLSVIAERPTARETTPLSPGAGQIVEKQPSSWSLLPKMMILQVSYSCSGISCYRITANIIVWSTCFP